MVDWLKDKRRKHDQPHKVLTGYLWRLAKLLSRRNPSLPDTAERVGKRSKAS